MSTSDHRGAGAALPITPFPGGRPAASKVQSNIVYEIMTRQESDGLCVPLQIGKGKFAKVYKASQRSAGRHIRSVAIKVLHDNANRSEERLFRQEALQDFRRGEHLERVPVRVEEGEPLEAQDDVRLRGFLLLPAQLDCSATLAAGARP